MHRTTILTAVAAAAAVALVGIGVAAGPAVGTPALSASVVAPAAIAPQVVQATVQPDASQAVLVPVPPNTDLTTLPYVTSSTPNLMVQSTSYTGDQKDLIVSLINADPYDATSGTLDVAGWGTYPATVQPNPSQLVNVPLPPGYDTTTLPYVVSQSPNLILISLSYTYVNGVQELQLNLGNPFPDSAVTGPVQIDW
jgi:hypothetical protein